MNVRNITHVYGPGALVMASNPPPPIGQVAGKRRKRRRLWLRALRMRLPWLIVTPTDAVWMAGAIKADLMRKRPPFKLWDEIRRRHAFKMEKPEFGLIFRDGI